MNPRLKSSKKWTAFPKEYSEQIQEVFQEGFKAQLGTHPVLVEGRIYSSEVLLRVTIKDSSHLRQANFEVSLEYSPLKKDALEKINHCIDAAASMMNDYFEAQLREEEVDFPLTWKEFDFNGTPIFLQFSTVNADLEKQADEILGQTEDPLLNENEDVEDALDFADEKIEAPDQEEDAPKGPQMFQSKKKPKKEPLH